MAANNQDNIKATFPTNQSGIALLIVLWVVVLLLTITLSFSVMARQEIFSTLTFKEQLENRYLAETGLQRGIVELFYSAANKNKQAFFVEEKILRTDGTTYIGNLDNGSYKLSMTDESGKININTLTDFSGIVLNNLLVNLGIEKETADTIVDSILDWKSPTGLHRLHGADSSYYSSLPNPYKAKNANFDNLEELLLVKGVTPDILYGNSQRPGLIRFLTVYGYANKININAAAPEVLRAIPFLSEDAVQKIITLRSADDAEAAAELQALLVGGDAGKVSPYIINTDSNIFAVDVSGYREDEKKYYPLRAIVYIQAGGNYTILSYQSPADIKQ
ncbi:MAG: general secretion pathway protein GspK [Syntrophales bacterium]